MTEQIAQPQPPVDEDLAKARRHVELHYRQALPLHAVARVARISPFEFHRQFRAAFGETPKQMQTRLRIERAKELLLAGERLAEIARYLGFAHQQHFTVVFGRIVGTPPGRWAREQRNRQHVAAAA